MKFHIFDCFAEGKYQGNQLAIFIPGKPISSCEMQRIAREMNFSETTFILSCKQENGGSDVRAFTPYIETPLAGHPVIGTAYVIDKYLARKTEDIILINLPCGQIPVLKSGEIYVMTQKQLVFSEFIEKKDAAQAISLPTESIVDNLPVQRVSTGLEAVIVALKSITDLEACAVNHPAMARCHAKWRKCNLLVYAHDENDLRVRMFMD